MRYSPSTGIAYYHIHKTGGTSLKQFLGAVVPDLQEVDRWPHHALGDYFAMLDRRGCDPSRLRILTTIRDPFAHVVSIYHFWKTQDSKHGAHIQAAKDLSFGDFVRFYVACPHPDCRVYDQLLLVEGVLPANLHILRLEDLAEGVDRVLNRDWKLGVAVSIPRVNASEHGPAAGLYDEPTRRLVRERYAWAFDRGFYS